MVELGEGVVEADGARRRSADEVPSRGQGDDRPGGRSGLDGDHEVAVGVGSASCVDRSVRRGTARGWTER